MGEPLNLQDATGVVVRDPVAQIISWGIVSPVAGAVGFHKGCLYLYIGGPADQHLYVNVGDRSSATWQSLEGGIVVAAQKFDISMFDMRNTTGALVGTSATGGILGITGGTMGTNTPILVGEAASGAAKTDVAQFGYALPNNYNPGGAVIMNITALWTVMAANTHNYVQGYAYDAKGDSTVLTGNLIANTPQTVTATAAVYSFPLTTTNCVPGQLLDCKVSLVADDTGGTSSTVLQITDINFTIDVVR